MISKSKAELRAAREARRAAFEQSLGRSLKSKSEFIASLREAVERATPFAAGRLGHSVQYWLLYPAVAAKTGIPRFVVGAYEKRLVFEAYNQAGIFPASAQYLLSFNDFFVPHLRGLDVLGLPLDNPRREIDVLRNYELGLRLVYYQDLVPDRSVPSDSGRCYLQYFAGKRLLIVCPFANVLRDRATQAIFEGVWAKTGKRWFYPANVDALEFPYGYEVETQKRYRNAEALFDDVAAQMASREFDVALIAASGLAIPLAAAAKQMGKIGLDLGGELQILFGVLGKRWRQREDWRRDYFNEWWIDTPGLYRPADPKASDGGDYW